MNAANVLVTGLMLLGFFAAPVSGAGAEGVLIETRYYVQKTGSGPDLLKAKVVIKNTGKVAISLPTRGIGPLVTVSGAVATLNYHVPQSVDEAGLPYIESKYSFFPVTLEPEEMTQFISSSPVASGSRFRQIEIVIDFTGPAAKRHGFYPLRIRESVDAEKGAVEPKGAEPKGSG